MIDLKPCPFCGGKARLIHGPEYWVECLECHAMSAMHTMEDLSIMEWNRRVKE